MSDNLRQDIHREYDEQIANEFVAWLQAQDIYLCWETNDAESNQTYVRMGATDRELTARFVIDRHKEE